jgi:hypothetical protein
MKKILFVTKYIPSPSYGGGLKRCLASIEALSKKYEIDLIGFWNDTFKDTKLEELENLNVNIFGYYLNNNILKSLNCCIKSIIYKTPIVNNRYYNRKIVNKIKHLVKENNYEFVFFSEISTIQYVKYIENNKYFFDDFNIEYELLERNSKASKFPMKNILKRESRLMKKFELEALNNSYKNFVVSKRDFDMLPRAIRNKTYILNNSYSIQPQYSGNLYEKPTICFVGSIGWKPNKEGLLRFIQNVYPKVNAKIGELEFYIIGSNIPKQIKKICLGTNIKTVENTIEEDKADIINKSWIMIAPIYFGSGTRVKILEYWAHSKVVVTTKIGAEGLEDSEGTIIIDDDTKMAEKIIKLLKDKEKIKYYGNKNHDVFIKYYEKGKIYGNSFYNAINT